MKKLISMFMSLMLALLMTSSIAAEVVEPLREAILQNPLSLPQSNSFSSVQPNVASGSFNPLDIQTNEIVNITATEVYLSYNYRRFRLEMPEDIRDAAASYEIILNNGAAEKVNYFIYENDIYVNSGELEYNKEYSFQIVVKNAEQQVIALSNVVTVIIPELITETTILQEDMTIDNSVILNGEVNLNGHKLTVLGDFIFENGSLTLGNGELEIMGNYLMRRPYSDYPGSIKYYESYGKLRMTNPYDYMLVHGDFVTQNYVYNEQSYITSGTIEVKGDFCQYGSSNDICFCSSGDSKVILSGDKAQNVTFESARSKFNILELNNYSEDGVVFNTFVSYNEFIPNDTKYIFNSDAVSGWKLEKDEIYDGDLLLGGNELDLNGYTLTINGTMTQIGGTVNINGGKLIVNGDYKMQSKDGAATTAILKMINKNDYMLVNGNVIVNSYNNSDNLIAGTLEVKGDLISANYYFYTEDNFNILLSGTAEQTINLNRSRIGNMEIKNTSDNGVTFSAPVDITKSFKNETSKVINGRNINLIEDAVIVGTVCNNDITFSDDNRKLESDLHIVGNCYINLDYSYNSMCSFDLNGYTLTVDKNCFLSSGQLYINTGKLNVGGDFRMEIVTVADDGIVLITCSNSSLQMTDIRDYVCVNGNFINYSNTSHKSIMTAGTLEIKGDFEEKLYEIGDNFYCTNNHKVILSGETHQEVSFESTNCRFNILELKNTSAEGVSFITTVYYNSFIPNDSKYTFETGDTAGWTLNKDEIYEGNLILTMDDLNLNGHTLTVKGNITQTGGIMNINGGKLIIEGDYKIQSADGDQGANAYLKMTKSTDYVIVVGDFVMQSNYDHSNYLTSGTLEVQGNINQISGNNNNFRSSGEFLLLLNGSEKQVVDISNEFSSINQLKIANSSSDGVEFLNYVYITKMLYQTDSPLKNSLYICLLNRGVIEDGIWKYDISVKNYNMNTPMHIGGNLYINGNVDMFGNTLIVDGDCVLSTGTLKVNCGHLEIGKDFRIEYCSPSADDHLRFGVGNGILSMKYSEDYILVSGNLIIHANIYDSEEYLTAGIIEVKGDICELERVNYNSFRGIKEHTVILSGEELQKVALQSGTSQFGILILENTSSEGVVFCSPIRYDKFVPNDSKYSFESEGTLGWKLEDDEVFEGDLFLNGGELNLNGHNLVVKGNVIQRGGNVNINGGKLNIEGDYRILSPNYVDVEPYLSMENDTDTVVVNGDFEMNGSDTKKAYLKSGVLEVKGDVICSNIALTGTLTLLLSGNIKQTVSAYQVGSLEIKNTSVDGVEFIREIIVNRALSNTNSVIINGRNILLQSGAAIEGNVWNHDITICSNTALNDDFQIKGDLYLTGSLDLNSHILKVDGNCIIQSGILMVNTGHLEIGKDLRIQRVRADTNGNVIYENSSGTLKMINAEDYVVVNGSYIYDGYKVYENYLTDGVLEIKGNLEACDDYYSFLSTGNHKVMFSGDTPQAVSFASSRSKFNIVELKNTSVEGVCFNEFVNYVKLIPNQSAYKFVSGENKDWTLEADEVYNGNLSFGGGKIDLNGHTLTIKGDLTQFAGNIDINGGHLIVEGNYTVGGTTSAIIMTKTSSVVSVCGDFVMQSSYKHIDYLTAGRLEVKGDFTILNAGDFTNFGQITVVLNGDDGQNFWTYNNNYISFSNLEINNTSTRGVTFMSNIMVTGNLKYISGVINNGYCVSVRAQGLNCNEWNGNLRICGATSLTRDVHIKGNLIMDGEINLNGKILTVDGSVYFGGGTFDINRGRLLIGKDLRYQYCYLYDGLLEISDNSSGTLKMICPEDYVCVNGDLVMYITEQYAMDRQNASLTAGILEVKGDVNGHETYPFLPSNTHKTVLNGTNVQTICFNSDESKFNILEINKPLESGYKFDTIPTWNKLLEKVQDDESPAMASNLYSIEKTTSSIQLEWTEAIDNLGVAGYDIYRNGLRVGTSSKPIFTDTGLNSNTEYSYYVVAFDAVGNRSDSSNIVTEITNIDENPPTAPEYLDIDKIDRRTNSLSWSKSTDDVKVAKYVIYRNGEEIGTAWSNEYTDTNLEPGNYTYTVKAVDNVGNYSLDSNAVLFDNLPPEVPTLVVGGILNNSVELSWVMDDTSDVKGYRVYKNGNLRVDTPYTSFTDNGILADTNYIFSVESYDAVGNVSQKSVAATVHTGADIMAPIVELNSLSARYSEKISIDVSARDDLGIDDFLLQYSTDGENWIDVQRYPTDLCAVWEKCAFNWDITSIAEGNVQLKISAIDRAGNVGSKILTTCIDHTAPTPAVLILDENLQLTWVDSKETDLSYFAVYRSETGMNKYIIIKDKLTVRQFADLEAIVDKKYDYAVVCVDTAGNRSEYSNIVTGGLDSDKKAPVINSVFPTDGATLSAKQRFSVNCQDNNRLKKLLVEYQFEGTDTWTQAYSEMLMQNQRYSSFVFNTEKLTAGNYTFRFVVEDAAGNQSESYLYKYICVDSDLIAPVLTVTPGAWKNELSWTAASSDSVKYNIYRKESEQVHRKIATTTDILYMDETVKAGTFYEYMVEAVDTYGRTVESGFVSAIATNEDSEMPVAVAYVNMTETVIDMKISFSGGSSHDNHEIMSYLWDFGDGYTSRECAPSHTYTKGGSYCVTLTVTDDVGNQGSDSVIVLVRDDNYSYITINVTDTEYEPLSNTMVYCDIPDSNVTECITNSKGVVNLVMKNGTYPMYFYKEGYEPICKDLFISEGGYFNVVLSQKELLTGEINVKRMGLDEIKEQNIDINAPENQFVFGYAAEIIFDPSKGPEEVNLIVNGYGELINTSQKYSWSSGTSQGGGGSGGGIAYFKAIPNKSHPEIPPTIVMFNISWLKEFFEVEMTVMNNADTMFPIESAEAVLNLPEGLSLASNTPLQTLVKKIGKVPGKSSITCSWFVRGDKAGNYNIDADFNGMLMPFNIPVSVKFVTDEPITVYGGNALKLDITYRIKDDFTGVEYAEFDLTNISDIDIHNVNVNLAGLITENNVEEIHLEYPSGLLEVIKWSENGQDGETVIFLPALIGEEADYSRTLKPGEKLHGILVIVNR